MEHALPNPKDKWIPRYFVIFFAVIAILDGIFVYTAITTQTGVITKQPYEKGLAFNAVLEKAKSQPNLKHKPSYKNGTLRWELPIDNALVTARIVRPVQDGYDFKITLKHIGNGVYEAHPTMPLPGAWTANLSATWEDKQFQTSYNFLAQ